MPTAVDLRYGRTFSAGTHVSRNPRYARFVASYVMCFPAGVVALRSNQLNESKMHQGYTYCLFAFWQTLLLPQ